MITTPRLLLRPWNKTDLSAMAAVSGDERVMQYFPGIQDEAYVEAFIQRQQLQQKERGHCFFAAELRETKEVIGFIGLAYMPLETDFSPCVEIGWRLHPDTWGKGLAPEGAKACIEFGFNELDLAEIYAYTPLANLPSRRVMEKIGMDPFTVFKHPALKEHPEIEECVVYRVVRG
ncbi:MAG: GNAT family N-acetyltransferase [Lewinella sp.]